MIKVYHYQNCGTCKKAVKFLGSHNVKYTLIPIRETPPTKTELKQMLSFYNGDIKKLFNTSGLDYKKLNLKDKLSSMNQEAAIELLSKNGNLIKRPFILTEKKGLVGFKEDQWKEIFL